MKRLIQGAGLAAALGLAGGFGGVANAAVLTFSGNICSGGGVCGHFSPIDQSYGDIAGVDVQYNRNINNIGYTTGAVGSELMAWDTAYNDLLDVAFGDSGGGTPMIFLRPTGGTVTLNGLDLGAWPNAVNGSQLTIVDGLGVILYTSGPISIGAGNLHNHFAFNLTSSNGLGIQWGPDGYNVGIDNVDFCFNCGGQGGGVPEPATWAMMIAGFGLTGVAIRRRRLLTTV